MDLGELAVAINTLEGIIWALNEILNLDGLEVNENNASTVNAVHALADVALKEVVQIRKDVIDFA